MSVGFQHLIPTLALAVSLVPGIAQGHISLLSHEARDGLDIKDGPCGRPGSSRTTDKVYTYPPGATITLTWDEPIPHPGYFRIAFDDDGFDDFEDPADYDDFFTNSTVMLDNLYPHENAAAYTEYSYDVTLPDIECDNCTLQLVQMMKDKGPYIPGTNDLYYSCIDLVLDTNAPAVPGPLPDPGPSSQNSQVPVGNTMTAAGCQQAGDPLALLTILMAAGCALGGRRVRRRGGRGRDD